MTMRALLDVNAFLALADQNHVHHRIVRDWWAGSHSFGWASCPLTENGFLRIITQPSYPSPLPIGMALQMLAAAFAEGDHEFWPDDISLTDAGHFEHGLILGPKQVTDIYLLALAVHRGGRLVTLDRSISIASVKGAKADNLVVLG
jgi:toxin-antitoxin system PIN domain toxin